MGEGLKVVAIEMFAPEDLGFILCCMADQGTGPFVEAVEAGIAGFHEQGRVDVDHKPPCSRVHCGEPSEEVKKIRRDMLAGLELA